MKTHRETLIEEMESLNKRIKYSRERFEGYLSLKQYTKFKKLRNKLGVGWIETIDITKVTTKKRIVMEFENWKKCVRQWNILQRRLDFELIIGEVA